MTHDEKVFAWRLEVLLRLGFSIALAEQMAVSHIDLWTVRRLLSQGCPPRLAARILADTHLEDIRLCVSSILQPALSISTEP